MLLENNSKKVNTLLEQFNILTNIEKIRLSKEVLENNHINYNFKDEIDILNHVLELLDPKEKKKIKNFGNYKKLIFIESKYYEFDKTDKRHYIIEILFNIYEEDFDNNINTIINKHSDIYNLTYKLLGV